MASISSTRKGRANALRSDDAAIWDDGKIRVVGDFRQAVYEALGQTPRSEGEIQVDLDSMSSQEVGEVIPLDDTLSIPQDLTIVRDVVGVYRYRLSGTWGRSLLEERYIVIGEDDRVLDLIKSRTATEQEIYSALHFEPPREFKPQPVLPVYARIERKPDDNASFLGFTVGRDDKKIKTAPGWTIQPFHLPTAQVVGRVKISLEFRPLESDSLELAVFTAYGDRLLHIQMAAPEQQFDAVRFPAGDNFIAFRSPSALAGMGSYRSPNSTLTNTLLDRPSLDALLWPDCKPDVAPNLEPAVPKFEFSAR